MPAPTPKAAWPLARCAQVAVAAAAVADLVRATTLRAHRLHPEDTPLSASGQASMVYLYVMTAAVVLFLVWMARCRRTAELLSPGAVTGSAAWAVFAWLIPGVNLWAPRGLVLGIQRASGPGGAPGRDEVLVNVWWAAWAGHAVLLAAGELVGLGTSAVLLFATQALELAAAALAIAVIQRVTARQATGLRSLVPESAPGGLPHAS
ncbi:DUF4328 domain-containing protein [Streptomyces cinerochromogenes]|uniref:DUF4328 domain-containing protein n=1 Tax=Streptomyces cinerochromogenes TaxID=66422 RepID=UPI00368CDEC6